MMLETNIQTSFLPFIGPLLAFFVEIILFACVFFKPAFRNPTHILMSNYKHIDMPC